MTDEVYRAIAASASGFVEAPAGCGKTEAIVQTVRMHCRDPQLILTHTHAGVDALKQRFKRYQVPASKYFIDTIAGWAWRWVRHYPGNSGYAGSIDIADWGSVYAAMSRLLQKDFVRRVVLNSYAGVIVDEYQDCTMPMHQLIAVLKGVLPCRVLGDPLQGIFGFRDERLVGWRDVQAEFANDLGALRDPHRWIKAQNEPLGRWLLDSRTSFLQDVEPDFNGSPVERRQVNYRNLSAQLIGLTHGKQGRICVIGPKARRLNAATETALVNQNYKVLEPNELSALKNLIETLADGLIDQKSTAVLSFLEDAYSGLGDDKDFISKILSGARQRPQREDRKALCANHVDGPTPNLILALLNYIEAVGGIASKLRESIGALRCILEEYIETGKSLKALYADEIAKRKHQSRSNVFRCIGSTLLVKGLEFDHAIILRDPNWQRSWGTHKDLYVALTRGSKTVTLIDLVAA